MCCICNKQINHKYKAKKEWNIHGYLCGDCHIDKMKEQYEKNLIQKCVICRNNKPISDMWEPRWQWNMKGILCENCFTKKEEEFNRKKNFCCVCNTKLGLIRYNPKKTWDIDGQLCKTCWNNTKIEKG